VPRTNKKERGPMLARAFDYVLIYPFASSSYRGFPANEVLGFQNKTNQRKKGRGTKLLAKAGATS
jgi:hypothetical protein